MNKAKWREYLEYARSGKAKAIAFVRKNLKHANDSKWVDILEFRELYANDELKPESNQIKKPKGLCYGFIKCSLYPKKSEPCYPSRKHFESDEQYISICRYITWATANGDIKLLKSRKYIPPTYIIHGKLLLVSSPDTFFVPGTPPEILELLDNFYDRTNPLWDKAVHYISRPIYEYQIIGIKRVKN